MLELAVIVLSILFLCGLPVGIPLCICALVLCVLDIIGFIVRMVHKAHEAEEEVRKKFFDTYFSEKKEQTENEKL